MSSFTRILSCFAVAAATTMNVIPARAATYYWDADGDGSAATGGTGAWDIFPRLFGV